MKQRVPSRVPTAPAAQRTWDHAPASDLHAARAVGPVSHSPLMLNVVPSRRDRFLQDPPGPLVPPATFFPRVPSRVSVQSPRSKVQSFREAGPPVPDLGPWTSDLGLTGKRPDRTSTVRSRLTDAAGNLFLPYVKKDPHHRRGSFFVPAGILSPAAETLQTADAAQPRREKRIAIRAQAIARVQKPLTLLSHKSPIRPRSVSRNSGVASRASLAAGRTRPRVCQFRHRATGVTGRRRNLCTAFRL